MKKTFILTIFHEMHEAALLAESAKAKKATAPAPAKKAAAKKKAAAPAKKSSK